MKEKIEKKKKRGIRLALSYYRFSYDNLNTAP